MGLRFLGPHPLKLMQQSSAIWLAFAWFFCILGGYFVIRPVRETMSVASGQDSLNWLFLGTFIAMMLAIPVYSACVALLARRVLVATVYRFFSLCLLAFWWAFQTESPETRVWIARAFFVWVSVFGLYITTVFWSVLADLFSPEDAKRSFGIVAAGGTVGAIAGSVAASQLAHHWSTHHLMLIPAILLEVGLWFASGLERTIAFAGGDRLSSIQDDGAPTGGSVADGLMHVVRAPYLRWVCLSLFLGQLCATQIYLQQAGIVGASIPSESGRTKLFADMNLGVQLLTLLLQTGVTGLLLRKMGLSLVLAITPLAYTIAFALLGFSPSLAVFVVADIVRRGIAYGIAVPAREVLFTVLSREDKYKSKGLIDTVILRGGDALSSQLLAAAKAMFISPSSLQCLMLPIGAIWLAVSVRLGAWHEVLARPLVSNPPTSSPPTSE